MGTPSEEESFLELKEQINGLVKRHNYLAQKSGLIKRNMSQKQKDVDALNKDIEIELRLIRAGLSQLNEDMSHVNAAKDKITSNFKLIAKSDEFIRLKKRIEKLKYEEYIFRKELYDLLK